MDTFSTRNIEALIKFPFRDPEWKQKLLLLAVASLVGFFIPVLPWIVSLGYLAQILRAAAFQHSLPALPRWDDLDAILKDGLRLVGVVVILLLPAVLLFGMAYGAMFAGVMADAGRYAGPDSNAPVLSILGFFFFFGLSLLVAVAAMVVLPVIVAHVSATRRFAAAFAVGEWWPLFRANWLGFLIAVTLAVAVSYILAFAYQWLIFTIVLICLFPFIIAAASAYTGAIAAALFGSAYRDAKEKIAPAAAPAQPAQQPLAG